MPRILFRRDNAENWTAFNPVLHAGEFAWEIDTNKIKIGNGIAQWNDLPYLLAPSGSGASAYEVAVEQGYLGTEEDWLATLEGPPGPAGPHGGELIPFTHAGPAVVADYLTRYYLFTNGTITNLRLSAGIAPRGSALVVALKKNGTTVATLSLAIAAFTVTSTPALAVVAGDYLTVSITAIGSVAAGSDLSVQARWI